MADEHGGGGGIRELLAIFGFEVDTSALKKGESGVIDFVEKIKHAAGAFASAFAAHEVFEFVENQVHAMHAVERTAIALGISTEKVQAFQFAAKALGEDSETLVNLMGKLEVSQAKAAAGGGKAGGAFAQLGVGLKDTNGQLKPVDQLFLDLSEKLVGVKDPAKQAAIVTDLFGKGGRTLLPVLKRGKEGLADLIKQYKELGGGFTEDSIEKSKEFEEQQAKVNLVWQKTKELVARALLPVLTALTSWATKAIKWFNDLAKNSNIFQAALVVLGAAAVVFGAQMLIAFAPVIAIIAAVAALVLLIDDLITLFQGGDSLIGDWIDKAFGKGQSTALVKELKDMWDSVSQKIKEAYEWLKAHTEQLKEGLSIAGKIVKYTVGLPAVVGSAIGEEIGTELGNRDSIAGAEYTGKINHPERLLKKALPILNQGGSSGGTGTSNLTVEVHATMDPDKHKQTIEKVVKRHNKQERVTAQSRHQRAPSQ
jgi:hypothetical protein